MRIRNRRLQAGMASSDLMKVVIGTVVIGIGVGIIRALPWDLQSPIPGIDFEWGRTVVMIGFVLLLFPVIKTFFLVPLKEAIDTRNGELERTFTEAEDLRTSMDQLRKDYEQRLAATEASAREQIQAQIREAQTLRQTLMAEATQKADAMVEQARSQIEQEKAKALVDIRSSVVDLTLAAAEKVVNANLDDKRNRQLVDDFISSVEAAR